MITNEEKISVITNRLNNLELSIKSLTDNAELCKDKYSLEIEIGLCNTAINVLLQELNSLGGVWIKP